MFIEDDPRIYVAHNDQRLGPFSKLKLKALFESNEIAPDTLVWFQGLKEWTQLERITSLFDYCQSSGVAVELSPDQNHILSTQPLPGKIENYFVSHWRGNLSASRSFWVNTVVPILAFAVLIANAGQVSDIIGKRYSVGGVWLLYASAFVLFGGMFIWQSVGLWRVSNSQENSENVNAVIRAVVVFYSIAVLPSFIYFASNISPISGKDFTPRQFSVSTSGEVIFIRGALEYGIADHFAEQLYSGKQISLVALDSEGGLISEANKISEKIEETALKTVIVGKCLSACTKVFASGSERIVLHHSNIGFHSAKSLFNIKELGDEQTVEFYSYLVERGFPEEMVQEIVQTPAEDMWFAPTMPLYESGFITQILASLDDLGSAANASNIAVPNPFAEYGDDPSVVRLSSGNLRIPVIDGLLTFRKGDYIYELFNSMTYGENELAIVLVRAQDHHDENFENNGYRLYARVEVLMPHLKVDGKMFQEVKRQLAENYQTMLSEIEGNLQTELAKGSQRFSQVAEEDVRIDGVKMRPVKLVENNDNFLLYEIDLTSQVYVNGISTKVHQSGLQSLLKLNNSLIMVNWYSDQGSPELRSEMYDLAYEFIRSSMAINQ